MAGGGLPGLRGGAGHTGPGGLRRTGKRAVAAAERFVRSGVFDPWATPEYELEREEEEWLRVVAAAQRPPAERKRITHKSSPEEVAAFRAAVQRGNDELAERVGARLEEFWTPREERFARDLERLWEEAVWINQTGQFPDGRPMRQQKRIMLQVWGLFINAMNRRMYGGTDRADEEASGGTDRAGEEARRGRGETAMGEEANEL